jgi:hypothetical protein
VQSTQLLVLGLPYLHTLLFSSTILFNYLPRTNIPTMGFAIKKPADATGSAMPAICIGLFVAFGGVLFGYVLLTHISTSHVPTLTSTDMTLVPSVAFLL